MSRGERGKKPAVREEHRARQGGTSERVELEQPLPAGAGSEELGEGQEVGRVLNLVPINSRLESKGRRVVSRGVTYQESICPRTNGVTVEDGLGVKGAGRPIGSLSQVCSGHKDLSNGHSSEGGE